MAILRDTTPKAYPAKKGGSNKKKYLSAIGFAAYLTVALWLNHESAETKSSKPFYNGPWRTYTVKYTGTVDYMLRRNKYPKLLAERGYDDNADRMRDSIYARNPLLPPEVPSGKEISLPDIDFLTRKK